MCKQVCCVLHAFWAIIYTAAGSVQLVAGIFFLLSLPIFKLGSNIWTGACNVLIGVGTFMLSCFGNLSKTRSQKLLLLTLAALILNVVNLIILEVGEWFMFMTEDIASMIERNNLHDLAYYARISTSVTTAIVIVVAFVDSQLTFCSVQHFKQSSLRRQNQNETVSDIEYIIPRNKARSLSLNKFQTESHYNQSWVYDSETGISTVAEPPEIKNQPSAPMDSEVLYRRSEQKSDIQHYSSTPIIKDNAGIVTVQVADTPGHIGNGDRQINHMKSFSRTPSPAEASQSSSSSSIPPIYECLERLTQPTVYRSRLSTYKNINKNASSCSSSKSILQTSDNEHYASLMVELESSFVNKKEKKSSLYSAPPSTTSKSSTLYSYCNESLTEIFNTRQRGSDAEFSKELEAALKLIQDLESPNTIDTPSETYKSGGHDSMEKRKNCEGDKNYSDSAKTSSGSSSLDGKTKKILPLESQSTSGYNSPSLDQSTRMSLTTGTSSTDLTKSQENGLSCVIRHMGDTAVISLFSPTKEPHPYSSADKILEIMPREKRFNNNVDNREKRTTSMLELKSRKHEGDEKPTKAKISRWKNFIDRKRTPSLLPEVEKAIIKSECLAFLSKSELEDRLNQTKTIHRQIEAKVQRQRSLRKAESFGSVEDIIDRNGFDTCF